MDFEGAGGSGIDLEKSGIHLVEFSAREIEYGVILKDFDDFEQNPSIMNSLEGQIGTSPNLSFRTVQNAKKLFKIIRILQNYSIFDFSGREFVQMNPRAIPNRFQTLSHLQNL